MKKLNKHKIFILIMALLTLVLLLFFFKEIIFEIIRCYLKDDYEGAKQLLTDKGIFGFLAIIIVEALQMVVVFISAEFIQISAGLTYPWYIAWGLCTLGVFFGASIIYALVKLTKFDTSMFKKSSDKITSISSKNRSTQFIMYFLFVMPIIPFGAICYYASNTKIKYRRYIFTCVTGVIPSILTSILLGNIITIAFKENIPWWIVLLSIVLVMITLGFIGTLIAKKMLINEKSKTPDSPFYKILLKIFRKVVKKKTKVKFLEGEFDLPNEPFILLSNHPSPYDMYYVTEYCYPRRLSFILNKFYLKNKVINAILSQIGIIPKKLFSPDIETIKKTIKSIKTGYPVYMCPEGRLCIDGTNYYITKETGKFIKQLKVPVVIMTIKGAYINKPKWRKNRINSLVTTEITHIISKEEINNLSPNEINDVINKKISFNDFDYIIENDLKFNYKKKAEGLENILYHCPNCHNDYTIETNKNTIKCNHCGFKLEINEQYHFNNNEFNIKNIHDYYELIKKYEINNVNDDFILSCDVKVKKFNFKNNKLNEKGIGKCTLTKNEFKYEGNLKINSFSIPLNILKGLPFSCGEEFECYYNDELYYFYPTTNKQQCAKWALLVDEIVKGQEEDEQQ